MEDIPSSYLPRSRTTQILLLEAGVGQGEGRKEMRLLSRLPAAPWVASSPPTLGLPCALAGPFASSRVEAFPPVPSASLCLQAFLFLSPNHQTLDTGHWTTTLPFTPNRGHEAWRVSGKHFSGRAPTMCPLKTQTQACGIKLGTWSQANETKALMW